jgi:hypothetical protein
MGQEYIEARLTMITPDTRGDEINNEYKYNYGYINYFDLDSS